MVGVKGQERARLALRVRTCSETGKSKRCIASLTQCVDYLLCSLVPWRAQNTIYALLVLDLQRGER